MAFPLARDAGAGFLGGGCAAFPLCVGPFFGPGFAVASAAGTGFAAGLAAGFAACLAARLAAGLAAGLAVCLATGLAAALAGGLAAGLAAGFAEFLAAGLAACLAAGLAACLAAGLAAATAAFSATFGGSGGFAGTRAPCCRCDWHAFGFFSGPLLELEEALSHLGRFASPCSTVPERLRFWPEAGLALALFEVLLPSPSAPEARFFSGGGVGRAGFSGTGEGCFLVILLLTCGVEGDALLEASGEEEVGEGGVGGVASCSAPALAAPAARHSSAPAGPLSTSSV